MTRLSRVTGVFTLVCAGCSLFNSLDRYQSGDPEVGPRGDGGVDATTDAPRESEPSEGGATDATAPPCDIAKPFGTPTALTELNSTDEDTLSDVSADGLTAYMASNRPDAGAPGIHLFYAKRASAESLWGPLLPLFPIGSFDDWSVAVTTDERTAVAVSSRGGNMDLFVATRANAAAAFGPLAVAAGTNTSAAEESPHWAADGKTLYFDSTRSGNRDLFVASVGSTFGAPQPIGELNTAALEAVPVVSPDELTMYFLSARAPTPDGDIYVATRPSKAAPWANVQPLANVNSSALDAPGQVSPDGCTLYLSSKRTGNFDAYVARRPK